MFSASSQYANRSGMGYSGDSQSQSGIKQFKPSARSMNIPMNSSMGMSSQGYPEQNSDRENSGLPISLFGNQGGYLGMNLPNMSAAASAHREQRDLSMGNASGQFNNNSQYGYLDKSSLGRAACGADTKNKVDAKVRSERFMKELQNILTSQLEQIKHGIIKDLKSYKEVDESVKRSMGLSVDSLSESIELLKTDIKNVVKNYARKVEDSITEQRNDIDEMSKQFNQRVKVLFPNSKNSRKKSADELEEELNTTISGLSGEISTLQRELEAIRSQIQVDGSYIKDRLENLALKEHEGFKLAAKGQEEVQKQILEVIQACQNQPSPVKNEPEAPKLDPSWEEKILKKANKSFQATMNLYSRKTLTLEREIEKLKEREGKLEQELKLVKQSQRPQTAGMQQERNQSMGGSASKTMGSASKNWSLVQQLAALQSETGLGKTASSRCKSREVEDSDGEESSVQRWEVRASGKTKGKAKQGAQLETSVGRHTETSVGRQSEPSTGKESSGASQNSKLMPSGRMKAKMEAQIALEELRARNSMWEFLRRPMSPEESEESEDEVASRVGSRRGGKQSRPVGRPPVGSGKSGDKVSVKNPFKEERESTKKKVAALAGAEVAEAMDKQGEIIDKATRSVRRLRVAASVA